jgi:hypothetical protein
MVTRIDENLRAELCEVIVKYYPTCADERTVLRVLADIVGDILANSKEEDAREYLRVVGQQFRQYVEMEARRRAYFERRQGVLPLESN